ncbi:FAD-binding oxidoreductase [Actinomadura flavalba]|uniref:FAD-binding oxidoreductase n=1 Tax=Actinomadura flavalba TaxID=1120938 RepID=UPI0003758253|nr:FAD-binding protein [Actinomadura flavalba]
MDLSSALQPFGTVHTPGDPGFDAARRPWNLAVDQPVDAVVTARDARDVIGLVRYAAGAGLTVTAQPSGHGATGRTGGTVLLRTGALDTLEIDAAARTARAGAGVRWGDVLSAAAPHGLVGLAGSSPVVTVTGYTLGGGLGWFARRHGFASAAVRAFDVVAADGTPARVTEASDPDLFWALRGGGGDLAVVTALEFDLFPAPHLYGGRMLWPAARARDVLDAYREVTAAAPDALTAWFDLLHFPGGDPLVAVDVTHLGTDAEARRLLRPLESVGGALSDTRGPLAPGDLGTITDEPTDPAAGVSRGELLTSLDADALLAEPIAPLLSVQVRHLGGALAAPSGGAADPITEPFSLYLFGLPHLGDIAAAQDALVGRLPVTGRKPFTNLARDESASDAFVPATLDRLRALKKDRDPNGTLRSNFPL